MKKFFIWSISMFIFLQAQSQITTNEGPISLRKNLQTVLNENQIVDLPLPDMEIIRKEDSVSDGNLDKPRRVGVRIPVSLNMNTSGVWTTLPSGDRMWQLTLRAENAQTLDLVFDKFWIPKGGRFFVFNPLTGNTIGAVTSEYLKGSQDSPAIFSTALIEGDIITLEYYQPKGVKQIPIIEVSGVNYGYRTLNRNIVIKGLDISSSCEIDINCPEGNNWQKEKLSVARILAKDAHGLSWCTGALVGNTSNNCSPLLLTANHNLNGVFDATANTDMSEWIFYWNYEYTGCGSGSISSYKTTTGATLKANNSITDFALLELTQDPRELYGFIPYYLGWDRSGWSGSGGVGIHHPCGDVKKISTYSVTPSSVKFNTNDPVKSYWSVTWQSGIMEAGSSGSPLINNERHIIGQLRGGNVACNSYTNNNGIYFSPSNPCVYGKFSVSWNGYGSLDSRRRLCDWLDPLGLNTSTLDGTYGFSIEGSSVLCSSNVYSIENLPSGASVAWNLSGSEASNFTIQNNIPSNGKCTIVKKNGASFGSSYFYLSLSATVYMNGTSVNISKQISGNSGKVFNYDMPACSSYYNYNTLYPSVSNAPISPGSTTFAPVGCMLKLRSGYLVGKQISFIGTPWMFNQELHDEIRFSLAPPSASQSLTVIVGAKDCDDEVRFTFYPLPESGMIYAYSVDMTPEGEQHYKLAIGENEEFSSIPTQNDRSEVVSEETSTTNLETPTGTPAWSVNAINAKTGVKAFQADLSQPTYILDTSHWAPGVYVVRAFTGGDVIFAKKIIVK